jgi:hypothetical protein
MDARVVSAFTRVFDALLPAHDAFNKLLHPAPLSRERADTTRVNCLRKGACPRCRRGSDRRGGTRWETSTGAAALRAGGARHVGPSLRGTSSSFRRGFCHALAVRDLHRAVVPNYRWPENIAVTAIEISAVVPPSPSAPPRRSAPPGFAGRNGGDAAAHRLNMIQSRARPADHRLVQAWHGPNAMMAFASGFFPSCSRPRVAEVEPDLLDSCTRSGRAGSSHQDPAARRASLCVFRHEGRRPRRRRAIVGEFWLTAASAISRCRSRSPIPPPCSWR